MLCVLQLGVMPKVFAILILSQIMGSKYWQKIWNWDDPQGLRVIFRPGSDHYSDLHRFFNVWHNLLMFVRFVFNIFILCWLCFRPHSYLISLLNYVYLSRTLLFLLFISFFKNVHIFINFRNNIFVFHHRN